MPPPLHIRRATHALAGWARELAYQGISGDNIINTGTIDWFDYCLPGDIHGNADIFGTYLNQGYDILTPVTLADPFEMIADIAQNIARWAQTGELAPISFGRLVKTRFDLGVFLRDFPHDKYGVWADHPGLDRTCAFGEPPQLLGPRLPTLLEV